MDIEIINKKSIILNLAGGRMNPLGLIENSKEEDYFIINVDRMYKKSSQFLSNYDYKNYIKNENCDYYNHYVKSNITEFLNDCMIYFDRICMYRYLEHVGYSDALYLIYQLSTITKKDSIIDVIVPDYIKLCNIIPGLTGEFNNNFILCQTELFNEINDPHKLITTPKTVKYLFELEKRFKVEKIIENFEFDGRNIYLRFLIRRL